MIELLCTHHCQILKYDIWGVLFLNFYFLVSYKQFQVEKIKICLVMTVFLRRKDWEIPSYDDFSIKDKKLRFSMFTLLFVKTQKSQRFKSVDKVEPIIFIASALMRSLSKVWCKSNMCVFNMWGKCILLKQIMYLNYFFLPKQRSHYFTKCHSNFSLLVWFKSILQK